MGRDVDNSASGKRPCVAISQTDPAIAAMNQGHRLSYQSDSASLRSAIEAYSQAIEILTSLPDKTTHANSLGAAYMNRGQLQHRLHGTQHSHLALADFDQAAAILKSALNTASPWPRRNLVGTLINHANFLLDLNEFDRAKSKAEVALAANANANATDPTDCELSLLATRSYCDAVGQLLPSLPPAQQESLANLAHAQAQTALQLVRSLRPLLTVEPFAGLSIRLFHFACLLNATHQPNSLHRFILEHLENLQDESARTYFSNTAQQSIQLAVNTIHQNLLKPDTSPEEQDQLARTAQNLGTLHTQFSHR